MRLPKDLHLISENYGEMVVSLERSYGANVIVFKQKNFFGEFSFRLWESDLNEVNKWFQKASILFDRLNSEGPEKFQ